MSNEQFEDYSLYVYPNGNHQAASEHAQAIHRAGGYVHIYFDKDSGLFLTPDFNQTAGTGLASQLKQIANLENDYTKHWSPSGFLTYTSSAAITALAVSEVAQSRFDGYIATLFGMSAVFAGVTHLHKKSLKQQQQMRGAAIEIIKGNLTLGLQNRDMPYGF